MLGSIKRRAEYRDYARAIDGCLKLLFYNFPEGTLERLRPTLNVEDTAWETFSRKDKNITANECGVMIARTLLGTYVEGLSQPQKQALREAFDTRDGSHLLYRALAEMDSSARELVDDMQAGLLLYEVAGKLNGLSREEIDCLWAQNATNYFVDAIRDNRPPPPSTGLAAMGHWLEHRRMEEETEKQREQGRLNNLKTLWAKFEPTVLQAIDLVNAKLAEHSEMHLIKSAPDYFGRDRDGFGIECKLNVPTTGYEDLPLVITEEGLYVAGLHHWGEGNKISLHQVAVETLANEIADGVKALIEG